MQNVMKFIPGFIVIMALAVLAFMLGGWLQWSHHLLAISLGFIVGNLGNFSTASRQSFKQIEHHGLSFAVVLLGAQLQWSVLQNLSMQVLLLIVSGLVLTFMFAMLARKLFRLQWFDALLLACGQAICGSAAVMACQRVIQAPSNQAALAVVVINFLGFIGVYITPLLATFFLNQETTLSGLLIGNTLQSMGHVVTAGFGMNQAVGETAVLIKLCRILMLVPVLLLLSIFFRSKQAVEEKLTLRWLQIWPWFIWGFLLFFLVSNVWILPEYMLGVLERICDVLFLLAMVAIGLGVRLSALKESGTSFLFLGGLIFLSQLCFSLVYLKFVLTQ